MHGSYGSPDENWFRWLEKELIILGHTVILEQFPADNWDEVTQIGPEKIATYTPKQNLQIWDDFFASNILPKIVSTPTIFIGHSIAPIFILHMLQKYDFQLSGAVFVSPFFNIPDRPPIWQFYPANKTFYTYDFDFTKIKSQLGKTFVVYGDDDPYVPAEESPLFADKLKSDLILVPGGGHCGGKFKEFPLVLELSQKLLS